MLLDRYAVMGNPIAHSKSPEIHRLFAQQTGQEMTYDKILAGTGSFAEEASAFFALGGKGLNVTVPFKEQAFHYADNLTDRAELAGAVNTLVLEPDGNVVGDTTDGAGLVSDLQRLGWPLAEARILILGAGGAVRGVIQPLLAQPIARLTIANRTDAKAHQLAQLFGALGPIDACGYDALGDSQYDLIINGTSASLAGEIPPLNTHCIQAGTRVYDMMYSAEATAFIRWAQAQGVAACSDGLGMLVAQAAESFYLWRGVRPGIQPVIDAVRQAMATPPGL